MCRTSKAPNYGHDDVDELNGWAIEVSQCIDRALAAQPAGAQQPIGSNNGFTAPQSESQPVPVPRWDEMIRQQFPDMPPKGWSDTLIRRYMTRELDAYRAARAPADSVLEDAAQVEIDLFNDLNRIYGNTLTAYAKEMCRLGYRKTNAARKQGETNEH